MAWIISSARPAIQDESVRAASPRRSGAMARARPVYEVRGPARSPLVTRSGRLPWDRRSSLAEGLGPLRDGGDRVCDESGPRALGRVDTAGSRSRAGRRAGRGSELIGADDLAAVAGAEVPPGHAVDRALDEADAAVAHRDVDAAGVRCWPGRSRCRRGRSGRRTRSRGGSRCRGTASRSGSGGG